MSQRLNQTTSHIMGSFQPSPPDLDSIISRLNLDEKISLLAGKDFWTTNPVERVGVPPLKVSDGPNGARGALAQETRTKGATVLLGPTVCPHRDPRGGRNFESFSEDPFLAGELASDYINGLQSAGVGATIKHYAVNESETKRFTIDARLSQRALREIYLKPFEIAVKKSDPWALMTSYNLVNGTHADASNFLITKVLREEWGFKGLVMSDWGGVNSTAEGLNAGHDLEMPGPALHRTFEKVSAAIKKGALTEETLNKRVKKVLELLVRTGKFENPTIDDEKAVDLPAHRQLIRQAGAEGITLLKNENGALPIKKEKVKSVALIGLAKEFLGHGGGSAAVNAHHKITSYDALQEAMGSAVELKYAEGVRILRNLKPLSEDVVDGAGASGFTCSIETTNGTTETKNIPGSAYQALERTDVKAVELTGTYTPQTGGSHYLSFATLGDTTVWINEKPVFVAEGVSADVMAMLLGTAPEERKQYNFTAGQTYKIRIKAHAISGNNSDLAILSHPIVCFNLGFALQQDFEADLHAQAIEAAQNSDVAVVFVGHTPVWETEGCDRDTMDLPVDGSQDELIRTVASVNKTTIVVNSTGSPVTMPWINDVAAVVQAWFPGQEAGYAIADVLLGKVNPSGKLPVTFPRRIEDAPTYANFPFTDKLDDLHVDYNEDLNIGYRHYDRHPDAILFPFGHGLSYTTFAISDIQLSSTPQQPLTPTDTLAISASITNTGPCVGSETLQVYVGPSSAPSDRPIKTLAGFTKIRDLAPQGSAIATVEVSVRDAFSHWDEDCYAWIVPAGKYTVYVATSSAKRDIVAEIEVEIGPEGVFAP
jgi:beta-glucosidase